MTTPTARPDGPTLAIGTAFGGYRITELAGRQPGMGKVYVATHVESERRLEFPPWPVALKVFTPPRSAAGVFNRDFEEFARMQAQLRHPSLVSIYEVGTEPRPYISMTLFRGPNLADLIASGELDDAMVLSVISSVAAALEAGYERDLVFRRLRPSSVLVSTDREHAFLADFGAGRAASTKELIDGEDLGTFLDYISPEEAGGSRVDQAANVYSLASIAFECLTGEPPYPRQVGPQALETRLSQAPRSLSVLRPDLPQAISDVLQRAFDGDPRRRYSSPTDFTKALTKAYPRRRRRGHLYDAVTAIAGMPAIAATPPLGSEDRRTGRLRRGLGRAEAGGVARRPRRRQREEHGGQEAAATAETATARQPEAGSEPAAKEDRARRLSPALLLLVPLLALAAVLGAVAAPGNDPDPKASQPRQLESDRLGLAYPANWRPTRKVPDISGLELSDPVALTAPAEGHGGRGVLVAGRIPAGEPNLLPDAFLRQLPGRPERDTVDLGAVQAYRYKDLRPAGLGRGLQLYVIPTERTPVVLGCLMPAGTHTFAESCERVASTISLGGDTATALAPSPTYARSLQRAMASLNRSRRDGRRRLATARTRSGQADAATRLARSYRAARVAASGLTVPPGARAQHAEVLRTLAAAAAAHDRLATAAGARDRGRWAAAVERARAADTAVQRSLANLRSLGYDPRPPA